MRITLRYFNRNDAWAVNYFVSSYCTAVLIVPFIQSIVILILVLIVSVALINATIFLAKKGTVTLLSLLS